MCCKSGVRCIFLQKIEALLNFIIVGMKDSFLQLVEFGVLNATVCVKLGDNGRFNNSALDNN